MTYVPNHNVRFGYCPFWLTAVQRLDVADSSELARIKEKVVARVPISPSDYFAMDDIVGAEAARLKDEHAAHEWLLSAGSRTEAENARGRPKP